MLRVAGHLILPGYHMQQLWCLPASEGHRCQGLYTCLTQNYRETILPGPQFLIPVSSAWLAWPRTGGYLESKKLWSVKPALPYLNPNSQVLGELTKPFRWFYMKVNLVGSRPSSCWGAHQVSLRDLRTRQSLTGFSVGSRGHESPRRIGVHLRSFLWCSSNKSPFVGILLSHNDHLPTHSIDFVILL